MTTRSEDITATGPAPEGTGASASSNISSGSAVTYDGDTPGSGYEGAYSGALSHRQKTNEYLTNIKAALAAKKAGDPINTEKSSAAKKFREILQGRKAMGPKLAATASEMEALTIDFTHLTCYFKGSEGFSDIAQIQAFTYLLESLCITINDDGREIGPKEITSSSSEERDFFIGLCLELEGNSPIKHIKGFSGKATSALDDGKTCARAEILHHVLRKKEMMYSIVKRGSYPCKKDGAPDRSVLRKYCSACFSGEKSGDNFYLRFLSLLRLFIETFEERLMKRIDVGDWIVPFSTYYSSLCRHKSITVMPKNRKKNQKVQIKTIAIKPNKPWELPGIRKIEKPAIREMYSPLFEDFKTLEEAWNLIEFNKDEWKASLKTLSERITSSINRQWETRKLVGRCLERRRTLFKGGNAPAEKNKVLTEFCQAEENNKREYLNDDFDFVPLIVPKLTFKVFRPTETEVEYTRDQFLTLKTEAWLCFRRGYPITSDFYEQYIVQRERFFNPPPTDDPQSSKKK